MQPDRQAIMVSCYRLNYRKIEKQWLMSVFFQSASIKKQPTTCRLMPFFLSNVTSRLYFDSDLQYKSTEVENRSVLASLSTSLYVVNKVFFREEGLLNQKLHSKSRYFMGFFFTVKSLVSPSAPIHRHTGRTSLPQ